MSGALPSWAAQLAELYESGAASQFVLFGNVHDRRLLRSPEPRLGDLVEFLDAELLPGFDVVLTYDLGNGVRPLRGSEHLEGWSGQAELTKAKRSPRASVALLTHYLRYVANLARVGQPSLQVAVIVSDAQLVCPALQGGLNYDLNALAVLLREWASDPNLTAHPLATFLVTENLADLHPLVAEDPNAARLELPLPAAGELEAALEHLAPRVPSALADHGDSLGPLAGQLRGTTLSALESRLLLEEHRGTSLSREDLVALKKELVERDAGGLVEFLESDRTLDDLFGLEPLKDWLRGDLELWRQGELAALPKGYLLCGPVGTGKTYFVRCLAGEAGVPVVKLRNFRDRWVGSTEGNLERIFRLLDSLGRCFVFVDEADQTLGKRDAGGSDNGLSGRVYSMIAQRMSRPDDRGRVIWILASSRPDLIEVDLKRPGRIDVKIPLLPTSTPEEGLGLLRALCQRQGLEVPAGEGEDLLELVPDWLTPGAAEALAVRALRTARIGGLSPVDALRSCLEDYRAPIAREVLAEQIRLAIDEASDPAFLPPAFRS